jgi:hypothetical protein
VRTTGEAVNAVDGIADGIDGAELAVVVVMAATGLDPIEAARRLLTARAALHSALDADKRAGLEQRALELDPPAGPVDGDDSTTGRVTP